MTADTALEEASDEALMAGVVRGDHDSFRVLAARYMNMLYSVAFRMYPQKSDAEDIVQEALLRLWSKAHLWNREGGASVSSWIYRVTYNLCIDQKRREKGGAAVPVDDLQLAGDMAADKPLKDSQRRAVVSAAVQDLPERQRAALVLCHYQGLGNAEAAAIMGTTVKGIEGLLVRARKTLKERLQTHKGIL